jgi:hypothetical protein
MVQDQRDVEIPGMIESGPGCGGCMLSNAAQLAAIVACIPLYRRRAGLIGF